MDFLQCPNCGSSSFDHLSAGQLRCTYCGTVLEPSQVTHAVTVCPECQTENDLEARFCRTCGAALSERAAPAGIDLSRIDPAVGSIVATVVGSMLFPLVGAALGLYLGYRALRSARDAGSSTQLAKIAIAIAWIGLALQVVPIVFGAGMWGVSFCASALDSVLGFR